jgi:hypothetical protein
MQLTLLAPSLIIKLRPETSQPLMPRTIYEASVMLMVTPGAGTGSVQASARRAAHWRGCGVVAYSAGFASISWVISQRLPSGSVKCAMRSPPRLVGWELDKRDAPGFEFLVGAIDVRHTHGDISTRLPLELECRDIRP